LTEDSDPPNGSLEVGRVLRPHGLRGEVVVELVTNRTERVAPHARLTTEKADLEVVRARRIGRARGRDRWVVLFAGFSDQVMAEGLRDSVLRAPPIDDPAALWVHDLVGAEVVDDIGNALGRVVAVQSNPASDLLVLSGGALIPLRFIVSRQAGRVTVELPDGLLEL
jgi:16S rRNA processing protein RimM